MTNIQLASYPTVKAESISSKTRNKTKMPTPTTSIKYSTRVLAKAVRRERGGRRGRGEKEGGKSRRGKASKSKSKKYYKIVCIVDDMILHIKNLK